MSWKLLISPIRTKRDYKSDQDRSRKQVAEWSVYPTRQRSNSGRYNVRPLRVIKLNDVCTSHHFSLLEPRVQFSLLNILEDTTRHGNEGTFTLLYYYIKKLLSNNGDTSNGMNKTGRRTNQLAELGGGRKYVFKKVIDKL